MQKDLKAMLRDAVRGFHLPKYQDIPDVGLYLEQTVQYICGIYSCLGDDLLTGSMVGNYVKKDLIANPVKKRYNREQIAYLIFITMTKTVLSIEDIRRFIKVQQDTYAIQRAYDYFREEMENILFFVFGMKEKLDTVGSDDTLEKDMLRTMIIAAAHKLYLEKYLASLRHCGEQSIE